MELQFEKTGWPCLKTALSQAKSEEQTQEVRLGDSMPDIGRVLGAWGQVLLRGKEWRGNGMTVSVGVMAWVLYAPEDGSAPRTVETWIPMQLRWDFQETQYDGTILANCQVASMDARSLSARKLLVRSTVSVFAEALEPGVAEVWSPGQLPEDVRVLKRSYPVKLPREAGEKAFSLEEELQLPEMAERLIHWQLQPKIQEGNVLAGKGVFRGQAMIHILCAGPEGRLFTHDAEISFSQFADLDRDYDQDARIRVVPAVTALEMDLNSPDRVHLKAGLLGQFVVSDQPVLEIVEDAYSTTRTVTPTVEMLMLPSILDENVRDLWMEQELPLEGSRILETVLYAGQPKVSHSDENVNLAQEGMFQLLYEDGDSWKGTIVHTSQEYPVPADHHVTVRASSVPAGNAQGFLSGGLANLRGMMMVSTVTTGDSGIPMVTGLQMEEPSAPDPDRPSIILRRVRNASLWEIAKSSGSTVEAIQRANHLDGEPEDGQMILIPVL